jgi:hypothetical protein
VSADPAGCSSFLRVVVALDTRPPAGNVFLGIDDRTTRPPDPFLGVDPRYSIIQASTQARKHMSSTHENPNELSLLMELRLAFGPGTRLWAYRSREDLCYDWLHFKERRANASFREFALGLYIQEKEQTLHRASSSAIRRRVAAILKAYRVEKRQRIVPAVASPPRSNGGPRTQHDRGRQTLSLGELPVAQALFPDAGSPSLRVNEVAR